MNIDWTHAHVLANGVIYPMADGTIWFFDGETVKDVTPPKDLNLPKARKK